MWCVIPAAGKGTRMLAHAEGLPKSLVPLAGRPVLERLLDKLPSAVTHVCVVVPAGDHRIPDFLSRIDTDRALCTTHQAQPLGVGDAVYRARECVDGPFLTVMGDAFFSESLANFVEGWRVSGTEGSILTEQRLSSDRDGMGLLNVEAGLVTRVWKGLPADDRIRVAGAFILPEAFFEAHEALVAASEPEHEIEDAITRLLNSGSQFGAIAYDGWRRNINTTNDVMLVERHILRFP